jgi:DsbE subfamily thiol:disulfide oxidoreductase
MGWQAAPERGGALNRFVLPLGSLRAAARRADRRACDTRPRKGVIVSPLLGKSAPQFVAAGICSMNPNPLHYARTLRGHWSLVNVWGTWCEECRAEHATLLQIKQQGRVPIIGIDWKDDDDRRAPGSASSAIPTSMVGADREGRVAIDWGVYGAPRVFWSIRPARGLQARRRD